MRKRRRTADDFVRDMKAKQLHSTPGDMERKTSSLPEPRDLSDRLTTDVEKAMCQALPSPRPSNSSRIATPSFTLEPAVNG
jgi:hypothetical protein